MNTRQAVFSSYLVKDLPDDVIEGVWRIAEEESFDGGATIVRQFDRNSDLFIVLEGSVKIKSFSGEVIAELGEGSLLGEISLVDDAPRSATVTSVGQTRVARIPADRFRELMDSSPMMAMVIYRNIARILSARIRSTNVQLDALLARGH
ncbi:MAG: cyclic nucleotide-binding domain-containing protein [Fimbriimonadaceae bacterium]|nr:cyclic nucleotide-binding domain-containing protein [Fimbriimonadaceae bacterium]